MDVQPQVFQGSTLFNLHQLSTGQFNVNPKDFCQRVTATAHHPNNDFSNMRKRTYIQKIIFSGCYWSHFYLTFFIPATIFFLLNGQSVIRRQQNQRSRGLLISHDRSKLGAKFKVYNMASVSIRLIYLSMNDLVSIMTLLWQLRELLLKSTINQKRKQQKNFSLLLLSQRKAIQKLRLSKK